MSEIHRQGALSVTEGFTVHRGRRAGEPSAEHRVQSSITSKRAERGQHGAGAPNLGEGLEGGLRWALLNDEGLA